MMHANRWGRRSHIAWVHRVDANSQLCVLASLSLGDMVHGRLGHIVSERIWVDLECAQAAEVVDCPVLHRTQLL